MSKELLPLPAKYTRRQLETADDETWKRAVLLDQACYIRDQIKAAQTTPEQHDALVLALTMKQKELVRHEKAMIEAAMAASSSSSSKK
jgi:hypothetical protein